MREMRYLRNEFQWPVPPHNTSTPLVKVKVSQNYLTFSGHSDCEGRQFCRLPLWHIRRRISLFRKSSSGIFGAEEAHSRGFGALYLIRRTAEEHCPVHI